MRKFNDGTRLFAHRRAIGLPNVGFSPADAISVSTVPLRVTCVVAPHDDLSSVKSWTHRDQVTPPVPWRSTGPSPWKFVVSVVPHALVDPGIVGLIQRRRVMILKGDLGLPASHTRVYVGKETGRYRSRNVDGSHAFISADEECSESQCKSLTSLMTR